MILPAVILNAMILAVYWSFITPSPALAYFDFGLGSYVLQIFFGFGAAYWFAFKRTFTQRVYKNKNSAMAEGSQNATANEKDESLRPECQVSTDAD